MGKKSNKLISLAFFTLKILVFFSLTVVVFNFLVQKQRKTVFSAAYDLLLLNENL